MRGRLDCIRRFLLALLAFLLSGAVSTTAAQAATVKTVRYHGYSVTVPRAWPVYDVTRAPQTCVRFNRHAVYLGVPSPSQTCPATALGRTEAILISPTTQAPRSAPALGPQSTRFTSGAVTVTATWNHQRAVITHALHRASLPAAPASAPAAAPRHAPRAARTAQASAVYTGRGFDVCSTPSTRAMSAWGSSPYRGIGVYIGGTNMACSQPNLTSSWVGTQVAAGWHLILIYVGLQAPSNSCGCASISTSSSQAAAQGTAAANDAVADAQAIGIPAGSPIYDDMEYYSRTSTNTSAVMSYLGAWTSQLHALGYVSGVYGNSNSVMTDFVNRQGTGFAEPDDIWFAEWNGQQSTSTGYIPASYWANHQRIHQTGGSYDETHGGVTLNIDPDYVDAATAFAGGVVQAPPAPSLSVSPSATGPVTLSASWIGASGITGWTFLAVDASGAMTPIATVPIAGTTTKLTTHTASPYYEVQALGSGNQVLGISPAVALPPKLMVYGRTAFIPAVPRALGAVPVGCYTGNRCSVTTTITSGRTVIARTGTEPVGPNSTSLLYFRLTPRGTALLARARKLPVALSVHDASSGRTSTVGITLVAFSSVGRAGSRQLSYTGGVRVVGLTDFVSNGWVGGILAGCTGSVTCNTTTTLSVGSTVIARTGAEQMGENEDSYLLFTLTPAGHAMLLRAKGNHLTVRATLTSPSGTATANVALVRY